MNDACDNVNRDANAEENFEWLKNVLLHVTDGVAEVRTGGESGIK